jgi:hypothetical protein
VPRGDVAGSQTTKATLALRELIFAGELEAEIAGIGVLRNPVFSGQEGHGEPAPPRIRPLGDA